MYYHVMTRVYMGPALIVKTLATGEGYYDSSK